MRRSSLAAVVLAACGGSISDGGGGDGGDVDAEVPSLMALCQVEVRGVGTLEVETDYLPHVVQCENGAASSAALEAQAIAARSYLYYKLERESSISDGQGDQVYSCGRDPTTEHLAAV